MATADRVFRSACVDESHVVVNGEVECLRDLDEPREAHAEIVGCFVALDRLLSEPEPLSQFAFGSARGRYVP